MWNNTTIAKQLQILYPIIQAPMAGGPTTPELIAAVSNSGGLGSLGAGYMAPEKIREAIQAVRRLTEKPFSVNLFIPEDPQEDFTKIDKITEIMNPYRQALGIPNKPKIVGASLRIINEVKTRNKGVKAIIGTAKLKSVIFKALK